LGRDMSKKLLSRYDLTPINVPPLDLECYPF
jgi:hypothetical protein